jgi:arginine decarboxylase
MNIINISDLLHGDVCEVNNSLKGLVIGNRIPKDYFITKGKGESDITFHAGSYHLALQKAGIERMNIMTYSSILPAIAEEIPKPTRMTHGAVMECIMAVANGHQGERLTAGIISGLLYSKRTGKKYGGLVCEHNGNYSVEEVEEKLNDSLMELYVNGFHEKYDLKEKRIISESFIPQKIYGTALVALCFTNYIYPVISAIEA